MTKIHLGVCKDHDDNPLYEDFQIAGWGPEHLNYSGHCPINLGTSFPLPNKHSILLDFKTKGLLPLDLKEKKPMSRSSKFVDLVGCVTLYDDNWLNYPSKCVEVLFFNEKWGSYLVHTFIRYIQLLCIKSLHHPRSSLSSNPIFRATALWLVWTSHLTSQSCSNQEISKFSPFCHRTTPCCWKHNDLFLVCNYIYCGY